MIEFIGSTLAELDETSVVVPGHGPVMAYGDMQEFNEMLKTVRGRIVNLINNGKSLEEVIAAEPTAEFDEKYGDPGLLLNRAYHSLAR